MRGPIDPFRFQNTFSSDIFLSSDPIRPIVITSSARCPAGPFASIFMANRERLHALKCLKRQKKTQNYKNMSGSRLDAPLQQIGKVIIYLHIKLLIEDYERQTNKKLEDANQTSHFAVLCGSSGQPAFSSAFFCFNSNSRNADLNRGISSSTGPVRPCLPCPAVVE